MDNILVTGGAGFIGSNFIRKMIKYPVGIINLDLLTYAGNLSNLDGIEDKNYRFINGNICSKDLVEDIFKEYKPFKGCKLCFGISCR